MQLKDKRVLVPGGNGFLGKFLCPLLEKKGAIVISPNHDEYDMSKESDVVRLFVWSRPEIVINLCGYVGGISFNESRPANLFINNILPGILLLDISSKCNVEKFVQIGSVCEYPSITPIPFKESDIWKGYPEETNAPYGVAKRALLTYGQALRKQYDFNVIHLVLSNLYGPGDDFTVNGHVIPALIKKLVLGNGVIMGTGTPTREFLYVEDAAEMIVKATEKYSGYSPLNIGSGKEISIQKLVEIIQSATGFEGKIVFDKSKPDGQYRRCVDVSRASALGIKAKTELKDGIKKTVKWYKSEAYD